MGAQPSAPPVETVLLAACCAANPDHSVIEWQVCRLGISGSCTSCCTGCCIPGKQTTVCSAACVAAQCCDIALLRGCSDAVLRQLVNKLMKLPMTQGCSSDQSATLSCGNAATDKSAIAVDSAECRGVVLDIVSPPMPTRIAPALVHIGDVLAVGASQRFPSDGVVVVGATSVDESMVTGESRPVAKVCGDLVIGGTMNGDGLVHVRVTALPSMGTMARIVSLIQGAQAQRPQLQAIADVLASWFTPFILAAGVVTFVVWVAVGVAGLVSTGDLTPAPFALQFALSLIVVSCPCAIGLAVPTVVMVATSVAARLGLLLKSGAILEVLPRVRHVVFDKTGTLTTGALAVAQESCGWGRGGSAHECQPNFLVT